MYNREINTLIKELRTQADKHFGRNPEAVVDLVGAVSRAIKKSNENFREEEFMGAVIKARSAS